MRFRDAFGTVYDDGLFADLFPTCGQPAEAPWHLALVTALFAQSVIVYVCLLGMQVNS